MAYSIVRAFATDPEMVIFQYMTYLGRATFWGVEFCAVATDAGKVIFRYMSYRGRGTFLGGQI